MHLRIKKTKDRKTNDFVGYCFIAITLTPQESQIDLYSHAFGRKSTCKHRKTRDSNISFDSVNYFFPLCFFRPCVCPSHFLITPFGLVSFPGIHIKDCDRQLLCCPAFESFCLPLYRLWHSSRASPVSSHHVELLASGCRLCVMFWVQTRSGYRLFSSNSSSRFKCISQNVKSVPLKQRWVKAGVSVRKCGQNSNEWK